MRSSRLTVEREGFVTLPPAVCQAVGLRPGDILAIEACGSYFVLEIYRELLACGWEEYMDAPAFHGLVARFLSRPLTALEPGGQVRIPQEAFPLPEESELSLYADLRGSRHVLQLFRDP
jgi:hypothetical protein